MTEVRFAAGVRVGEILRVNPLGSLETRILLGHALQLSRVQLITQSERCLSEDEAQRASDLMRRRQSGEPVAYLTGQREFYGLPFQVTPDVLIPRPETELLVELAAEHLPDGGSLLDLGTGSGAIAIAVAHHRRDASVTAIDASTAALEIARANGARHGVHVRFLHSDWYAGLPDDLFDFIVSNPPYIAQDDPHLAQGDLRFEPADALTDHGDGLGALRAIVSGARRHLKPGGRLMIEHGYDQAGAVQALLRDAGFTELQNWPDLAGIIRVSGARLPPPQTSV